MNRLRSAFFDSSATRLVTYSPSIATVSPERSAAVNEMSSSTRSITVCSRRAPMFSTLEFTPDSIEAIADIAVSVNSTVENIGARRLQTVMERVLDDISFGAPDKSGEAVRIDGDYVRGRVADLAKNADLSRFIL